MAESSIQDVWQGIKYASDLSRNQRPFSKLTMFLKGPSRFLKFVYFFDIMRSSVEVTFQSYKTNFPSYGTSCII